MRRYFIWSVLILALPAAVAWMPCFAQTPAPSSTGQPLFASRCAGCHGLDGRGGEHAPNIVTEANVRRLADIDIARIIRDGIRPKGMPAFGTSLDDAQIAALVKYVRILQGQGRPETVSGNSERGQALFFGAAQCADCHMMNGVGGFIAADLSEYGKTHSAEEIRQAILEPDEDLDPRHPTIQVVTRSGQRYRGVLRNEDNFTLQMQTLDGNFHFFDKSKLAQIDRQTHSLMPADYGSKLSKSELNDLVSYLIGASRPNSEKSEGQAGEK